MTYIVSAQHKLLSVKSPCLACLALQPHANSCHVQRRTHYTPSCFLRPPRSCSTDALVNEGITRHAFTFTWSLGCLRTSLPTLYAFFLQPLSLHVPRLGRVVRPVGSRHSWYLFLFSILILPAITLHIPHSLLSDIML